MNSSPISIDMLNKYRKHIQDNPQFKAGINAVINNGTNGAALNYQSPIQMHYTFSLELDTGKVTAQKSSGRCWIFAGLNILRQAMSEKYNLENFELSQNYPMFWDKLEKSNYFLESILDTLEETTDSRIVMWLLRSPVQDGGQWDMFANLIEKYGVVPKYAMPETFHSSNSSQMNRLITTKLREQASVLRDAHTQGKKRPALIKMKEEMLQDIYRILVHCLGEPPLAFDFQIRDKDKKFIEKNEISPVEFYQEFVGLNIRDYVSIINAPTPDKPFNRMYTVQYLGNITGQKVRYLNLDIEALKALTLTQLRDNKPVWFGCDMGPQIDRKSGIMDMELYDYESSLSTPFQMNKAQRLEYGESLLTHAMVFTGVHLRDGKPVKWKVENSWGEDSGNKGYYIMSDSWFDEFNYQVVIHKKYLDKKLLAILDQEAIELAPWDPMGSLA